MDSLIEKLHLAWIGSGRDDAEFKQYVSSIKKLHVHEEYLLIRSGVTLPVEFLETAKSLLGEPAFDQILSSIKALVIEPGAMCVRNANGLLIYRICLAIHTPDALPPSLRMSNSDRKKVY